MGTPRFAHPPQLFRGFCEAISPPEGPTSRHSIETYRRLAYLWLKLFNHWEHQPQWPAAKLFGRRNVPGKLLSSHAHNPFRLAKDLCAASATDTGRNGRGGPKREQWSEWMVWNCRCKWKSLADTAQSIGCSARARWGGCNHHRRMPEWTGSR